MLSIALMALLSLSTPWSMPLGMSNPPSFTPDQYAAFAAAWPGHEFNPSYPMPTRTQQTPPDVCDTLDCGDLSSCTDNGDGTATCHLPAPPPPPPTPTLTVVEVQCLDVATQAFYVCGTLDLTRMQVPEPAPGTTSPLQAILSSDQLQVVTP